MNKTVVISGADGFIGSHLSKHLVKCGYEVYALSLSDSPTIGRIKDCTGINIVECDSDNYKNAARALPYKPRAFFHLAWIGVSPENRKSAQLQKANLDLVINAVNLAHEIDAQMFIFPGSTMEYSYSNHIINADAPPSPQNAYGAAKIAAKYFCEVMCKQYEIPFIYTVISGIYAADRIDNNVIYYTISSLLKGEKPKLTRLEQLWDYVHIDDVVKAFSLILEKGRGGSFYSIGHGDNQPLYKYIFKIRDIINPELPLGVGEVPYESNRLPMSVVDLTALQEDTGFIPHVDFETGIKEVIEEIKNQKSYSE